MRYAYRITVVEGGSRVKAIDYKLVFDVATSPDRWLSTLWPMLILTAVGLALVIIPQRIVDRIFSRGPKGPLGKMFAIVFFLFAAAFTVSAATDHFSQLKEVKAREKAGRLEFVEGCLQSFHPMPEGGHENEKIRVNGTDFAYSDFDESTPAFNNTGSHGGPIHADSAVRIWHFGNEILRVEVGDHACPSAPDLSVRPAALVRP
jgi:hypothetical protein